MNAEENPTSKTMADPEQTLSTTTEPQIDNPVAMTQVGEPDLVAQQQEDTKKHNQAVDVEQGDAASAATLATDGGDVETDTAQPTVDAQIIDNLVQEPIAEERVEDTIPSSEQTTLQMIEAQQKAGVAPTVEELTSHVEAQVEEPKVGTPAQEDTEAAVVNNEEQAPTRTDTETEETKDVPVKETPAAISAPQSDFDADDLFGSDDDVPKRSKTARSNADTDSVVEALSPARDSGRASAREGSAVEDEEEDEEMPQRKKRRGESPVSGDEDDAGVREARSEGAEDVKEDSRRDEDDDEERTAEPEETDEALARKRALDARIEAIGKSGKRKRSRKKDDSEDLGLDRQIEEMTTMMDNAIRNDIDMNKIRKPALSKTQILNRVIAVLQNASLQQSILESNDFLSTLRRFIEPMEDGSLPSLTIQKGILFQLGRLEGLEVIHLRNSGLGKVVNFYTRCKSCQPEIIRQANLLIDRWSKPILDTGNNARASARARAEAEREDQDDRHAAEGGERGEGGASNGDGGGRPKDRKAMRSGALLYQKVQADKEKGDDKQKSSRLPSHIVSDAVQLQPTPKSSRLTLSAFCWRPQGHAYAVAPAARRSAKGPEEQAMEEARQREAERINRFKKKAMQASR
ncbi:hypothetical protein QFC22_000230 [Naganishia vaughanmartiniae]|uniref:Uncharacterized protein n=1 Tax=Naganishia vaughanmartiniae TaxID=1424756 RepID=A0ACC2XMI5_9TREE|nr:hypothetical protein QFC22_000230 [Naganishia vaughanmartiniae]